MVKCQICVFATYFIHINIFQTKSSCSFSLSFLLEKIIKLQKFTIYSLFIYLKILKNASSLGLGGGGDGCSYLHWALTKLKPLGSVTHLVEACLNSASQS